MIYIPMLILIYIYIYIYIKWRRLNKLLRDATCKSDNFICCDPDLDVSNKCNE